MADIQKYIRDFDSNIRLKRFDENATLREKRDAVIDKLRSRLRAMRESGENVPTFTSFNQGSYQMGTGIKPGEGDYDIDVGVVFDVASSAEPDPVALKLLVCSCLDDHTSSPAEVRRSCVTVRYKMDGEHAYHVDLAVYAYDDLAKALADRKLRLAKGKSSSTNAHRFWEPSDPKGLIDWVRARFDDVEERAQFFRVIRALKRWKTHRFSTNGSAAPSGIALTVAAGRWFEPCVKKSFLSNTDPSPDDLTAMRRFVASLISRFVTVLTADAGTEYRLPVTMPVEPGNDLFAKMTDLQMTTLRDALVELKDVLETAAEAADPVAACEKMQSEFGEEFPVPAPEETGQKRGRAVSSAGVSA